MDVLCGRRIFTGILGSQWGSKPDVLCKKCMDVQTNVGNFRV